MSNFKRSDFRDAKRFKQGLSKKLNTGPMHQVDAEFYEELEPPKRRFWVARVIKGDSGRWQPDPQGDWHWAEAIGPEDALDWKRCDQ